MINFRNAFFAASMSITATIGLLPAYSKAAHLKDMASADQTTKFYLHERTPAKPASDGIMISQQGLNSEVCDFAITSKTSKIEVIGKVNNADAYFDFLNGKTITVNRNGSFHEVHERSDSLGQQEISDIPEIPVKGNDGRMAMVADTIRNLCFAPRL